MWWWIIPVMTFLAGIVVGWRIAVGSMITQEVKNQESRARFYRQLYGQGGILSD